MLFLILASVCFGFSVIIWLFFTMPFIKREFDESLGVPSTKVLVAFILDAIKAIHLLQLHQRKIPIAIQAHAISIVLSLIFIIVYIAELDYAK